MTLNSNQFPDVYTALGIKIPDLGCIMLDVDHFSSAEYVLQGDADLYESTNPDRFWIGGDVSKNTAHVTLLYGLLEKGLTWKPLVDIVLHDWVPPTLEIESVGVFQSPYTDEDYSCIVAHIKVTDELLEGHHRLSLLPHINTFPTYRPHLTLAYVKKEAEQKWIDALNDELTGKKLTVNKINYGGRNS